MISLNSLEIRRLRSKNRKADKQACTRKENTKMIRISIRFYNKKTKFIADEQKIDCPDDLVFAAAKGEELNIAMEENQAIDYINCRPFDVSNAMKKHAIEQYPELKEKFQKYDCSFIGRHNVPPGY
jgi:hypothetical protein